MLATLTVLDVLQDVFSPDCVKVFGKITFPDGRSCLTESILLRRDQYPCRWEKEGTIYISGWTFCERLPCRYETFATCVLLTQIIGGAL